MQKRVKQYIEKWKMITKDDTVIVGVSGGADSVCLLCILDELSKEMEFSLVAVHVNHGIRGEEAKRDEQYVQRLCKEREIPCEVIEEDVPHIARMQKLSEEEAGRNVRRKALEQVASLRGGNKIALAHHQDDNAETFFLNLARGSKLKGLGGICPVNGMYIRPLLCVGRMEIESFLQEKAISYCMDQTNLEDTYVRNRIRNHVLPFFKEEINEKTVEHMNGTMEYLREVYEFLQEQVEDVYRKVVSENTSGAMLLRKDAFDQTPRLLQNMVIRQALEKISGKKKDLEETHILAVRDLMSNQAGRRIDLPYGLIATRTYEGISVGTKKKDTVDLGKIVIELEEKGQWEFGGKRFTYRLFENTGDLTLVPKKMFTKWFDYDIIKGTIDIRTRGPGDQIVIDKKGNRKKLKSFFIDEKIPQEQRAQIPILAREDQVIWVVGYRQSVAYQVTEKTKTILEIIVDGGI